MKSFVGQMECLIKIDALEVVTRSINLTVPGESGEPYPEFPSHRPGLISTITKKDIGHCRHTKCEILQVNILLKKKYRVFPS